VSGSALATGFVLAASLLVAIGAQNAFVLRQGLRREHVLAIASACTVFDWLLIAAGMSGLGAAVHRNPGLAVWLSGGGAVFLFAYGALAFRRALLAEALRPQDAGPALGLREAMLQTAAFTFLNPHVYLDTVVLIGSVGARQPAGTAVSFFLGSAAASTAWFFGLGIGARLLTPVFANAVAWRVLDVLVGLTMFALAYSLAAGAVAGVRH
jgi:L-lysine exporter family protein LysE/ArgO